MTKPKVLLIGRYGHPADTGGIANAQRNIVRYAGEMDIDFRVMSIRTGSLIPEETPREVTYGAKQFRLDVIPSVKGFENKRTPHFEAAITSLADEVMSALGTEPVSLVHVFNAYPNYISVAAEVARRLDTSFIVSARGTDVYSHNPEYKYDRDKSWYLRPLTEATFVTVLSDFLRRELEQVLDSVGYQGLPIARIHNGVDPDVFKPMLKEGIPEGAIRAVYTGRIRSFKGILDIVQAVETARQTEVDVELDILGPSEEGKDAGAFQEIKDQIREHCLEGVVRCSGRYVANKDLPAVYGHHNLFMFASRCEGLPNAIMEAMSCGLAVALNEPSGSLDLLAETSGIMGFQTGDIERMAAIIGHLAKHPEELKRQGERNREFALNHHWRDIARQYASLYERVARRSVTAPVGTIGSGNIVYVDSIAPAKPNEVRSRTELSPSAKLVCLEMDDVSGRNKGVGMTTLADYVGFYSFLKDLGARCTVAVEPEFANKKVMRFIADHPDVFIATAHGTSRYGHYGPDTLPTGQVQERRTVDEMKKQWEFTIKAMQNLGFDIAMDGNGIFIPPMHMITDNAITALQSYGVKAIGNMNSYYPLDQLTHTNSKKQVVHLLAEPVEAFKLYRGVTFYPRFRLWAMDAGYATRQQIMTHLVERETRRAAAEHIDGSYDQYLESCVRDFGKICFDTGVAFYAHELNLSRNRPFMEVLLRIAQKGMFDNVVFGDARDLTDRYSQLSLSAQR